VVADGTTVWVADGCWPNAAISRIDTRTNAVVDTFVPGGNPVMLALGFGSLWAGVTANGVGAVHKGFVERIDPATGRVLGKIATDGGPPFGLAIGAGSVWAVATGTGTVLRIQPS